MLKLGFVRWRGACRKHKHFDPMQQGSGAIKGGCLRCASLLEIAKAHRHLLSLMRIFGPMRPPRPKPAPPDLQEKLFDY